MYVGLLYLYSRSSLHYLADSNCKVIIENFLYWGLPFVTTAAILLTVCMVFVEAECMGVVKVIYVQFNITICYVACRFASLCFSGSLA